jgi:hypothetical protein
MDRGSKGEQQSIRFEPIETCDRFWPRPSDLEDTENSHAQRQDYEKVSQTIIKTTIALECHKTSIKNGVPEGTPLPEFL